MTALKDIVLCYLHRHNEYFGKKNLEQNKSSPGWADKKTYPGIFVEHNELGQQTNLPSENKKSAVAVVR